jgi:isopentenyl-diphosphate delta-isomerase
MVKDSIILVNEKDEVVGSMAKMEVHKRGLLHRAFSVFVFNNKGELLLQQRAVTKYHSGGLWTNACCSHPAPGENTRESAERRLEEEMGFAIPLKKIFEFTYKTAFGNGLTEYEYDHVFLGEYNGQLQPNADEVQDYRFSSIEAIKTSIMQQPEMYTSWFLIALPMLENYLKEQAIITAAD